MKKVDPLELTVAQLAAHEVDSVDAICTFCGKSWPALISIMPDHTTLRKIRSLLICPACGGADVEIEPNWSEVPTAH